MSTPEVLGFQNVSAAISAVVKELQNLRTELAAIGQNDYGISAASATKLGSVC
jgi:hypothetical protein